MAIPIPDFTGLAGAQGGINQSAANQQTTANRPNQYNQYGSLTWTQGPNGQWTQTQTLAPGQQQLFDQTTAGQSALAGALGAPTAAGTQDWGDPTVNAGVSGMPQGGFGAAQNVIDAVKALQQPGLTQSRDAERARLAAMGITLGSDASNNTERLLSNAQSDADMKAILAGTQEYGNVFNRDLALRQQGISENQANFNNANALRNFQTGENINRRASDAAGLTALGGAKTSTNPVFAGFTGATALPPANLYQAGLDTYNAQLAQENANIANRANQQQGYANIGGAVLQGLGGVSGIINGAKNAWDWASNAWSDGGEDVLGDFIAANGW